jgi:ubiquinone/menaquinone biosynthesis C-methylase UbiE
MTNIDPETVEGFGEEWSAFDQTGMSDADHKRWIEGYFSLFPFADLPEGAEGFDLGCGSGRWAAFVAPQVGKLHCIDPAAKALDVAKRRLAGADNVTFHLASADSIPLADGSQDFGYSLGVLHHIPDTARALRDCTAKLKPGAPFLLYLYYALDNRPAWFRGIWRATDVVRRGIARMPFGLRKMVTTGIAATVYWPLARSAKLAERMGRDVRNWPLTTYRNFGFYSMQTDALDRFGTKLEQRFTRTEIEQMMREAGLSDIHFSEREPFWVACGTRA